MQKHQKDLQNLFNALDDFLFIIDLNGRILDVNPAAERRLGYSAKEFRGKHAAALHPPEQREEAARILSDIAAGKISTCPIPLMAKDGTVIPVETRVTRGTWSDQDVLFGISRDITEQRRAEQELPKQRAYFDQLFENSPDGILLVDDEDKTLAANKGFEKTFCYSLEEIRGRSVNDFIVPTHLLNEAANLTAHALQGGIVQKESVRKRKDGSLIDVEILGYPITVDSKMVGAYVIYKDISDRKKAEKAQRESEDRYRSLIERSGTGVCVIQDDRLRFVNSHLCQITGYSEEALLETEFLEFIHPDDRTLLREQAAKRLSGADIVKNYHYRGCRKDGAIIWLELWGALIEYEGRPAILTTIIDITERIVAEQALRESEEKYRLNFENVKDVIYTVDLDFRITDVSPSAETLLGYKPEEIIGRTFNELKLLAPEYYEIAFANTRRLLEGKKNPPTEYEFIAKDGTRKIGEVMSAPMMREGKIEGVISVARDITDRKAAERALQKSEEKYRELVQNASTIIMRLDPEGRITFFNEYAQEFFGYTEEEILGKHVLGTIVPETDSAGRDLVAMVEDATRHPEKYARNENENMRRNGERAWIAWTSKPIYDEAGQEKELLCVGLDITERRRAEQALKESEERYRILVDNALTGIYLRSKEGIFFSNKRLIEMLGYSMEELRTINFIDIIHPDDREIALKRSTDHLMGKATPGHREYRAITKSGEIIYVELSGVPIMYKGEQVILAHAQDVTDRKRALRALEESEKRYRTVVDDALTGIYIRSEDGLEFANKRLTEMLGYSMEELREMEFLELIHPEDRDRARKRAAQRMAGKKRTGNSEFRVIKRDGGFMWVDVMGRRIEFEGKPAVLTHIYDITERKKIREELKEREEQYRLLFETVGDVIYIIGRDLTLLSVSPSITPFLGYTPEELIGLKLGDKGALAPEYYQRAFENISKIFAGKSIPPTEYEFVANDGTRKLGELRAAPIYEEGEIVALIAICRDITQHRRLEEQLFQAQKMESIGTLAGGIAHDFNNILGGILGYASLMKTKTTENHPFFNYIDTIEKGAIRASELTAQLLAFARGGKYDIKAVNLNRVVDETLRIVGETFDKSIAIETRLLDELPTVAADEGQIQQALMNLFINAADAMPRGGTLTLETSVDNRVDDSSGPDIESEPGPWVVVSVSDTGIGMDRETMQRIFEPFFTTKEQGKGTGLGLSMVYGVVKNHGGHLHVHSKPGEGSTFRIYLPISGAPEAEETALREILQGGNELILVVDDEKPIRSLAREILENYGYRVLLAEDGEEAIKIFGEKMREIDLVILDMIMPKMGGQETFSRLKALDPTIRAVLSTGYSRDGKAQEILDEGMMGYIQKPYQVDTLLSKVRSALDVETES